MLAKNLADRYQTPTEVAQALTPFAKPGAAVSATLPSAPPGPIVLVPAAASRTEAGTQTHAPRPVSLATESAPSPTSPKPRRSRLPVALAAAVLLAVVGLVAVVGYRKLTGHGGTVASSSDTEDDNAGANDGPTPPVKPGKTWDELHRFRGLGPVVN